MLARRRPKAVRGNRGPPFPQGPRKEWHEPGLDDGRRFTGGSSCPCPRPSASPAWPGVMGPGGGRTRFRVVPRSATTRFPNSMPPPPSAARPRSATPSRSWSVASAWFTTCPAPAAAPSPAVGASCWKAASRRTRAWPGTSRTARRPAQDDVTGARERDHSARGRKGDPVDVQISLPDESKTTSLKGGILHRCELFTSDTTGNLRSIVQDGKAAAPSGDLKLGDLWAVAEGPVLAGQFVPAAARCRSRPTPMASRFTRSGAFGAAAKVVRNPTLFHPAQPRRSEPAHGL